MRIYKSELLKIVREELDQFLREANPYHKGKVRAVVVSLLRIKRRSIRSPTMRRV